MVSVWTQRVAPAVGQMQGHRARAEVELVGASAFGRAPGTDPWGGNVRKAPAVVGDNSEDSVVGSQVRTVGVPPEPVVAVEIGLATTGEEGGLLARSWAGELPEAHMQIVT